MVPPWVWLLVLRNGDVVGLVASNRYTIYRDICKVQLDSLGIFEHAGRSEAHGYLGLCVRPTAY